MGAFWFLVLVYALIFGFAAGTVRQNQGGRFREGFAWGCLLGLIGLIVVVATKPKPEVAASLPAAPTAPPRGPASPPPPSSPGSIATSAAPSPQQAPVAIRECPSCKESMRRDASVCPHCRRESDAWEYRDGLWWLDTEQGAVWLDESSQTWRSADEVATAQSEERYRASLISLGNDVKAAAKLFRDRSNADFTQGALRRIKPGTPIGSALPEEEAEALKQSLAHVGTVVEIELEH